MNAADEGTIRRRGRRILIAVAVAGAASIIGVQALRGRLVDGLCPATVTARGVSDGVSWDIARSDCGDARTVWQLRIVPLKGVSTLVYESDGEPLPVGWTQSGFAGTLRLSRPLDDGNITLDVPLDLKGRPVVPIRVHDGRRIASP